MDTGRSTLTATRERIIKGERGWWFLGPGGVARLSAGHLTDTNALRPDAERYLREQGLFTAPAYRRYSLTVLTSTACNLGCGYCFQNTGQDTKTGFRPPRIRNRRLTPDTIEQVLAFTAEQMARAGLDELVVMLFGGEPLLNPRGCLRLLQRAADLNLHSASMTSNGTLLTRPLVRQLADAGLRTVQITFDGDATTHDQIRVKRTGGATFDLIVDNIARVQDVAPIRWYLRINVSEYNHHTIDALVERLAERLDPARCALYLARVGDTGVGYRNDLLHSGEMLASFSRWQRRAVDLGFSVPRPRADVPCQACSFRDGRYGAVVSADGTLSSCWETAGKPDKMVGTVSTGYLSGDLTADRWTSCEESYRYDDDFSTVLAFRDALDASLLDYLSLTGRL
ncbi:MAG TPA: radical SAM protein [Mycobacteriales bacterium]|nr:radical SAM protein [Mycobacteriales bacterium]